MRMRRLVIGPTFPFVLAVFAAATVLSAASAQPPPKRYAATLNIGQETGTVKSAQRGAAGRFTASLSETTFVYKLTFAHLSGAATAAAHSRSGRPPRQCGRARATLCTLHVARHRQGHLDGGSGQDAPIRQDIRQRSHSEESQRRDPRPDHRRPLSQELLGEAF
jgi:hypothetical protein